MLPIPPFRGTSIPTIEKKGGEGTGGTLQGGLLWPTVDG